MRNQQTCCAPAEHIDKIEAPTAGGHSEIDNANPIAMRDAATVAVKGCERSRQNVRCLVSHDSGKRLWNTQRH